MRSFSKKVGIVMPRAIGANIGNFLTHLLSEDTIVLQNNGRPEVHVSKKIP